jgi:hypothetical protein
MIGKQNRVEICFCSVKLNGAERAKILISSMPSKNVGLDVSCEKKSFIHFFLRSTWCRNFAKSFYPPSISLSRSRATRKSEKTICFATTIATGTPTGLDNLVQLVTIWLFSCVQCYPKNEGHLVKKNSVMWCAVASLKPKFVSFKTGYLIL